MCSAELYLPEVLERPKTADKQANHSQITVSVELLVEFGSEAFLGDFHEPL